MAVAANETRRLLQRERRRFVAEIDMSHDAASHDPADRISLVDLARALRGLSVDDRRLLALRYAASLDSTHIADVLGISPSGVRSRLARLLERMRKELDDG